jgi:lipase chaperone LimK
MQIDEQKPASGTMEAKFPVLYKFRKDFPLCGYEVTMILEGMDNSISFWDKMLKNASNNEEHMYRVLEAKLHRADFKARLERLRDELFPPPF